MANKLSELPEEEPKKSKLFHIKMPSLTGKLGISLFLLKREIFIGIAIGEVEIEHITRRRLIKTKNARVQTYRFD